MTRKELAQQALNILKDENEQLYNTLAWYISCLEIENRELKNENQEALKIYTLLKNKEGYIKSQKGKMMKLRISNITYNGVKFMVNGYCLYSDNCRCLPLNKVYLKEVLEND